MRLAVAAICLLVSAPAFALDAVTYKGTLGGYDILAELVAVGPDQLAGRYSYLSRGGDIPLNVNGSVGGTSIVMFEEAPCTANTCQDMGEDGMVIDPPIGALWTLTPSTDGSSLTGQWMPMSKTKGLPIVLREIGRRTLPDDVELTPYGIYDSAFRLTYEGAGDGFTPQAAPYDFAKMDVPLDEGPVEALEGSTFRYVSDPRSKFAFPRIVSLSDGSSPDAANAALALRHAQINLYAFDCLAQIYAGFGANQYRVDSGAGTLGDYDSETVTLDYLSPTVMNWVESGSTYCIGAHPNNHSDTRIVDVRTGAPFALARVFKDWAATGNMIDYDAPVDQAAAVAEPQDYFWSAGQPLVDYALANRVPGTDADWEAECGMDDLIASNLALRFLPGERVLFTIEGLPHVSFACSQDVLTVRLRDIPDLLAPTAAEYFPSLAD